MKTHLLLVKTHEKPKDFDGLATPTIGSPMKIDEKSMVFDRFSVAKTHEKPNDFDGFATPPIGGPMKTSKNQSIFMF